MNQPRPELYGPSHKMIRFLLANLLVEMGQTSFHDPSQAEAILARMEEALVVCDSHIRHEDAHVRPALLARAPASVAALDAEHAEHALQVAELRGLARAVMEAPTPDGRRDLGHTLYLHFSVFVAETLAHAAYEERVVAPLLLRLFSTEELLAMHVAIVTSLTPQERAFGYEIMMAASNREERAALSAAAAREVA